jgi:hypothetical protein
VKSSKKKKYLFATSGLILLAGVVVFNNVNHEGRKISKIEVKKVSQKNILSYQTFQPSVNSTSKTNITRKQNKRVRKRIKNTVAGTRFPARSLRRGEDPLSIYIDKEVGKYGVSTNVYALPENITPGQGYEIITNKLGMNWVQGQSKPENALTVIKDPTTGKVGYYTGKIVLISKKTDVIKEYLDRGNESYNQISNTFIIELNDFESALEYADELRQKLPNSNVDVDLNFSRMTAK